MEQLLTQLKPVLNDKLYQKDPYSSELGLSILKSGISLIESLGLEHFNFKKLAKALNTTESSIYRYFENKHKLLLYISSWYWYWLEFRLMYSTSNLSSGDEKLKRTIHLLVFPIEDFEEVSGINMSLVKKIIISESSKVYLTKEVDVENKEGFFQPYKSFCFRISAILKEVNPKYEFPNSLVSTLIEGIHLQKFYQFHIPSLSDTKNYQSMERMFYELAVNTLKK